MAQSVVYFSLLTHSLFLGGQSLHMMPAEVSTRRDVLHRAAAVLVGVGGAAQPASAALDPSALQGLRREGESERQFRGRKLEAMKLPPRKLSPSGELSKGAIPEATAFPKLDSLAPLYEMFVGVQALTAASENPEQWPEVSKALNRIFAGGLFNLRNLYTGLAVSYVGNIDYSDPDRKLVEADVEVRLFAVNQCFDLLKTALKLIDDRLAAGSSTSTAATAPDGGDVQLRLSLKALMSSAQASMAAFIAMVPAEDLAKARAFEDVLLAMRIGNSPSSGGGSSSKVPMPPAFADDKELRDAFDFFCELNGDDKLFLRGGLGLGDAPAASAPPLPPPPPPLIPATAIVQ